MGALRLLFGAILFSFFHKNIVCYIFSRSRMNRHSRLFSTDTVVRQGASMQPQTDSKLKVGVLLLNLGGPETQKDVEGFLFNLFADPDIIRLPPILSVLQKPIAYVIAKRRAPKSSAAYKSIGGGSPIVNYTQAQADLIAQSLRDRGIDARCFFAMRYWHPYTEEALDMMQRDGVTSVVIVPLYPQYSISTSGSSLKLLQEIFYQKPHIWGTDKAVSDDYTPDRSVTSFEPQVQHTVVPSWYQRKGYVRVMAELILEEVAQYTATQVQQGIHVLFSAHGVPESYILAGDPYKRQIEECVRLIAKEVLRLVEAGHLAEKLVFEHAASDVHHIRDTPHVMRGQETLLEHSSLASALPQPQCVQYDSTHHDHCQLSGAAVGAHMSFHLSFQSRVGPVQWLKPYTEEVVVQLGAEGVKNLVVVPVSFVSEHIETLEEMDMEYRELAEEHGISNWRRVPAVNTDRRFIQDMADLVVEALEAPVLSLAEATQNLDMIEEEEAGGSSPGQVVKSMNGDSVTGLTSQAETLNARFAMLGLLGTTFYELLAGHPVVQLMHLR